MARKGQRKRECELTAKARRPASVRMRLEGQTFDAIAQHFGVSREAVRKDWQLFQQELDEQDQSNRDLASLHLARYEQIQAECWEQYRRSGKKNPADPRHLAPILKAMERVEKLRGLEAAQKIEGGSDSQPAEEEIFTVIVDTFEQAAAVRGKRFIRLSDNAA